MQERPDKLVLLSSIARFLIEEIRPKLADDPRLAFRALIAANLANIVASELSTDADLSGKELGRLRDIFPDAAKDPMPSAIDARRSEMTKLNLRLAKYLAEGDVPREDLAKIGAHLRATLREKLEVDNPRFELALDIE